MGLNYNCKEEKYNLIYEKKKNLNIRKNFHKIPNTIASYFDYIKSLGFSQEPDYQLIKNFFDFPFRDTFIPEWKNLNNINKSYEFIPPKAEDVPYRRKSANPPIIKYFEKTEDYAKV